MSNPNPVRFVTVAEAATSLGVSVRTVQRRIAAGELVSDRDDAGRVRVRLDAPGASDAPDTALVVRDTLTGVLDRYRASLDRLDRMRTRWLAFGVAGATLGVASVAALAFVSLGSVDRDRQVTAMRDDAASTNDALLASLRELADLRAELATATGLAVNLTERLRHADDRASQAVAECDRLTAERDTLADDLADLRTEFVFGPMASATR